MVSCLAGKPQNQMHDKRDFQLGQGICGVLKDSERIPSVEGFCGGLMDGLETELDPDEFLGILFF